MDSAEELDACIDEILGVDAVEDSTDVLQQVSPSMVSVPPAEASDESLGPRTLRRSYLVTYSRSNMVKFPTRESFAELLCRAFKENGGRISHWACCLEHHKDGKEHYHSLVKLDNLKRWLPVKDFLQEKANIVVNFGTNSTGGYHVGYKYIAKFDKNILHSDPHPNLTPLAYPRTQKALSKYMDNCAKRKEKQMLDESESGKKLNCSCQNDGRKRQKLATSKGLSMKVVGKFIFENGIRDVESFRKIAIARKNEGEEDLFDFIANNTSNSVSDLIGRMHGVKRTSLDHADVKPSPMETLQMAATENCEDGCNGKWLQYAKDILQRNDIELTDFSTAVRLALQKGRGKGNNIFLIGPKDCGKSLLLDPLEDIYNSFANPTTGKYAWIALEDKELIYLNDLRYTAELIAWSDFLRLLEGATVNLNRPRNMYATDLQINKKNDIPIFATGKDRIIFKGVHGVEDKRETDMMSCRWRYFEFNQSLPTSKIDRAAVSCKRCFANLVLLSAND